jgi:hypothetical protein
VKPAIRIVFAPLLNRNKKEGYYTHGETMVPGRTIKIDPRSSMLLDTLVHEITHANHPDWTEKMVRDYVKIWMKKSGWKRKAHFLKLLGNAIIEGEG